MEQLTGQSLDRYQMLELLGEGGMGAVYRARDVTLQRDVAIKVMQPQAARLPNFQERFLNEARTAARLDHPGIVKVHDFGQARGLLYIVMEYIRGDNLRRMLDDLRTAGRWVSLEEAAQLVGQVCLALDYAHRQGVLHRDIKPDNIMLKPEPGEGLPFRPVLTDLGLAKLLEGGMITQEGTSMGTPAYMSPEQALGTRTDARSDVYSLGILLFELAVGRLPFPIKTITEAIRYHTKEAPPLPRSLRPDLPEAVERVILEALAKDPAFRYPDCRAMAEALRSALPASVAEPAATGSLVTQYEQSVVRPRGPSIVAELPRVPVGPGQDRVAVLAPDGAVRAVDLRSGELTIGRDAENDLAIDDAKASGRHARVRFDGANYQVVDLNSANGTFVANVRLLPGVPQAWTPDKALRIGDTWLRLERGQPLPRPPASLAASAAGTMLGAPGEGGPTAKRVAAFIETPELSVDPGSSTTAILTVLNQGPVVDHFRVSVLGIPSAWVPAPPPLIRLLPGTQQQVSLVVQPPRSPESRAGTYPFKIQVASQDAPDQVAELSASLAVSAFQQFDLALRPQKRSGSQPPRFRAEVANWGNADLTAQLSAEDPEEACEYSFDPPAASVAPGQESTVQLTVRPKTGLVGNAPKTYRFTVTLRPPEVRWLAQQVQGEWERMPTPPMPRVQVGCGFSLLWVLATIVGGVLGGLAYALIRWEPVEIAVGWPGTVAAIDGLQGAILGLLQWLVLRRYLRGAARWIAATALGLGLDGFVRAAGGRSDAVRVLGACLIGLAQWLVLWRRVRWSGLWVPVSALAWLAGNYLIISLVSSGQVDFPAIGPLLLGSLDLAFVKSLGLPLDALVGQIGWAVSWVWEAALVALLTGIPLAFLLSRPVPRPVAETAATDWA